jgi:sodium/potassium-transporting ATPase subunit alpha
MFTTDSLVFTKTLTPDNARDEMVLKGNQSGVHQLRAVAGLCNAAEFDTASISLPLHERTIYGDATDQAILRFSEGLGSVSHLRQLWKKTYELSFNSRNKFMMKTFSIAEREGLEIALSSTEESQFQSDDT